MWRSQQETCKAQNWDIVKLFSASNGSPNFCIIEVWLIQVSAKTKLFIEQNMTQCWADAYSLAENLTFTRDTIEPNNCFRRKEQTYKETYTNSCEGKFVEWKTEIKLIITKRCKRNYVFLMIGYHVATFKLSDMRELH